MEITSLQTKIIQDFFQSENISFPFAGMNMYLNILMGNEI